MTTDEMKQLLKNIRKLERACLSKDNTPSTIASLREAGRDEVKRYYRWLRNQAPMTALGMADVL